MNKLQELRKQVNDTKRQQLRLAANVLCLTYDTDVAIELAHVAEYNALRFGPTRAMNPFEPKQEQEHVGIRNAYVRCVDPWLCDHDRAFLHRVHVVRTADARRAGSWRGLMTLPNTQTQTQTFLASLGACYEARSWVADRTLTQAWNECTRLDWLRWLLRAPLDADYKAKVATLYADYEARVAPLDADYEARVAPLYADYEAKIAPLYADYKAKVATLYADYKAKVATLYADYKAKVETLYADYEARVAPLDADYKAKVATLYADYKAKVATLYADYKAKVATLNAPKTCDEFRAVFSCPELTP